MQTQRYITGFLAAFIVGATLTARAEIFEVPRIDLESGWSEDPEELRDLIALNEIEALKKAKKKIPARLIIGFPHLLEKIFPVEAENRLFNILSGRKAFLKIIVNTTTQRMQLFEARFVSPLNIATRNDLAKNLDTVEYELTPLLTKAGLPIIIPVTTGSHTVKSISRPKGNGEYYRTSTVGYTEPGTFVVKSAENQHYSKAFKCWLTNYCEFNDGAAVHETPGNHSPDELGLVSLIGTSGGSGGCVRTTPAAAKYIRKIIEDKYETLYSEVEVLETRDTLQCTGTGKDSVAERRFEITLAADRELVRVIETSNDQPKHLFTGHDGRMLWKYNSRKEKTERYLNVSNRKGRRNPYFHEDISDRNTVPVELITLSLFDDDPKKNFGANYSGTLVESFERLNNPFNFDKNAPLSALPIEETTTLKCSRSESYGNFIALDTVLIDDPETGKLFRGEMVRRQEATKKAAEKAAQEALNPTPKAAKSTSKKKKK